MSLAYELTVEAEEDLLQILLYNEEKHGLAIARLVKERFIKAFELLEENPEIGSCNEDVAPLPYRVWPLGPSNILYRADVEPIQIVRIGRPGDWMQGVER